MKQIHAMLVATILAVSCVTGPSVPDSSPATPPVAEPVKVAPVRKERIEEYKTPLMLKETITFSDGMIDRVIAYEYSEDKQRLLSSVARKPSSPEPVERITYEYKGAQLVVKSTFGADGALSGKSEFAYDTSGNLLGEVIIDGKGTIQSASEYAWASGRKVSWLVKSSTGIVMAKTDYSYEGVSLASARIFDGAGNSKGKVEYGYGPGASLSSVKYYDAAGAQDGRIEYTLKDGRVAKESVYRPDGRLERQVSYEYAPDGALMKKTLADSSGKTREVVVYENTYRIDKRTVVYYE